MSPLGLASSQNEFSCAVRCDGAVWCWGNNDWGQLGDGTLEERRAPVAVRALGGPAASVSAGYTSACAVVGAGAWCWGDNAAGQLGDGTRTSRGTPMRVEGITGTVVAVAVGGVHACALVDDGTLWCWGGNQYGGLGDGTNASRLRPAVARALDAPAVEVVTGQYHTCARTRDGAVLCWGLNMYGALGDGTTVDRYTPVQVSLPDAAVALASTSNHTCAVLADGALWCWGFNSDGAVARPPANQLRPVAIALGGLRALAVATGQRHTCAIVEGPELRCWGRNDTGQLGDGSAVRRVSPVAVAGLDGAPTRISAGVAFSCAALADGRTCCWGGGVHGQLGHGSVDDSPAPATVALPQ